MWAWVVVQHSIFCVVHWHVQHGTCTSHDNHCSDTIGLNSNAFSAALSVWTTVAVCTHNTSHSKLHAFLSVGLSSPVSLCTAANCNTQNSPLTSMFYYFSNHSSPVVCRDFFMYNYGTFCIFSQSVSSSNIDNLCWSGASDYKINGHCWKS